jgi:hypothetical protein
MAEVTAAMFQQLKTLEAMLTYEQWGQNSNLTCPLMASPRIEVVMVLKRNLLTTGRETP